MCTLHMRVCTWSTRAPGVLESGREGGEQTREKELLAVRPKGSDQNDPSLREPGTDKIAVGVPGHAHAVAHDSDVLGRDAERSNGAHFSQKGPKTSTSDRAEAFVTQMTGAKEVGFITYITL